jgi:GNAT superfamily N-acetyltransferase
MLVSVCDTACREVERVARKELERNDWCLDEGTLVVEPDLNNVRWRFVLSQAPVGDARFDAEEMARLDCRLHPDDHLMWIGDLSVSRHRRRRGWGRRLVRAAEGVARNMGCNKVVVFPLVDSLPFWRRLGYLPHPRKARVLLKRVAIPSIVCDPHV